MARENQGLHAALIVFVVLTIVLAVTTFVFFSQYNEAKKRAEDSKTREDQMTNLANDKGKLLTEFQRMMGFGENDNPDTIRERFNEDMQRYAPPGIDDQSRVYREVLKRQDENYNLTDQAYQGELANRKQLEEDFKTFKETAAKELAQFEERAKQAETDHTREAEQFAKSRNRLAQEKDDLAENLVQVKRDHQEQLGQKEGLIAKLKDDLTSISDYYAIVKNTVDKMRQEIPDQFQGEVQLVDQRMGTIWVNRGEDDGLRPQTKFSIFPAGSSNLVEAKKKASIEITRVFKGHLSEARIVDDDPLDPILVGDKIYTPVWSVGEKRHFALVGLIDLDGDGRGDLARMHALIAMNGGVVDAPMDAQGNRQGEMSIHTRYLVVGKEYGANTPSELRADYVKMTEQADKLRIETITLDKFLELMGWVRQVKLARFGGGGHFPVERETAPSVSTGKISDFYKPRHPPQSSRRSPY